MTTPNNDWSEFLKFYSNLHDGHKTRLGVFEMQRNVVNDYWIEDGLPLAGLTLESSNGHNKILITMGDMTHEVDDVIKLTFHCTSTGQEDGLDILDRKHRMTILRFEAAR